MSTAVAPRHASLVARLHDAARVALPVIVHQVNGTTITGRVREVGLDRAVIRDGRGEARGILLDDVLRVLRADGRQWWPPREVTAP
jgi:hypothetical protein